MNDAARPLVSIVTVVRNGMPFILDNLASVARQDYPALEHWIIDGASTDGTVEAIRMHAASLAGWVSEPDAGIAEAFTKGLSRARGDYIMFLNSDDALASPDAMAALVEGARSQGWPDIPYGDCDLIDRDTGRFLYRYAFEFDPGRFLRFDLPPHPGMLMHRRFFDRHGKFDTSFRISMDYELQLRGFPGSSVVRIPVLVTRVRTGGLSALNPLLGIEENIRALQMTGHLRGWHEAARIRAYHRLRFAARRVLEATGLYGLFVAARQRMARRRAGLH